MPLEKTRPPFEDPNLKKTADTALLLATRLEARLEIGATAFLNDLWETPRKYTYKGMEQTCRYAEIPEPGYAFRDGRQPDQMTFLQVSASEELQRVRESLITEAGVREALTGDDGKLPSEKEVQSRLTLNREAWEDGQAIYEMVYRSRVKRSQNLHYRLTPAESAAEALFAQAKVAASEIIIAINYAEFYGQIRQRANAMAKDARAIEHINLLFNAAVKYGVHHARNAVIDAFLGGPVISTLSSFATGHSWGSFKLDRLYGNRSIFLDETWGYLHRDEQKFFEAYNRFGELVNNREGGLLHTDRQTGHQTRRKFKHGMGLGLPGMKDHRAQALALSLLLRNPHREAVDSIAYAAFVREAGDYVINNI